MDDAGLSADEAARRLAEDGPDRLPEPPPSRLRLALTQFTNGMVALLAGAAAVALAFGQGR
jgi:magnesium-transporting ATPase (P-type)